VDFVENQSGFDGFKVWTL